MRIAALFYLALGLGASAHAAELELLAAMNGASVISATESKATGQARARLQDGGKVTIDLAFTGLASGASGVDLLLGKATANGIPITSLNVGEGEMGANAQGLTAALTPEQERAMRDGMTYIVVRTIDFPAGAIRGQLEPQAPALLGLPIAPTDTSDSNAAEPTTDR